MSVVRAELHAPAVISIAQRQGMLAVVPTGQSGPPGPMTNWRMSSGWIQARAVGYGGDWTNVVELADITPPMPAHQWNNTQLRFETAPGVWGPYVDLKGDAVEIGVDGGFIRWRPVGGAWTNIVELADLIGPDGPAIEVQTTATHIQWRVVGDPTWINLVALTDIKGDQGDPGPIGINLPLGPWNSATAYVARDVVTLNGSSYICLLGHTNQSPPTPPATANTYWSLLASKGDTPTVIDLDAVEGLNSELLGSAHSAITVAATDIVAEFVYDTTLDDDKGAWRHRCAHTSWWQEAASATRGAKREFPQKVKIVARSGVTNPIAIYDITDLNSDGSAKLWWAGGGAAYAPSAGVSTPAAIFALNGRVWIAYAGSSGSLRELDFVSDRYLLYTNSSGSTRRGTGLTTGLGSQNISATVPLLVSRDCNHVHARVYPGAPVDTLGLPIPKVVASTAAGASVIHEDGSVYDITVASGYVQGRLLDGGRLMLSRASADIVEFGPVPYADIANTSWRTNTAFGTGTAGASNLRVAGSGVLRLAENAIAGNSTASGALTFIAEDPANPAGSMFAYSAVAYATGWQVGDIRGAYLCDTTTGNITGTAELVTNGDFATGATGWTQVFGTVAQTGGKLRCTALGGTGARAAQSITCVVGQTYLLSVDITNVSANGTVFVNTTSATGTGAVAIETGVTGRRLLQFVATATTMFVVLQVQSTTDGHATDFDNVSVKLAVPDRSYKAKGLQVVGTLSRTAVNTGNDLVAFSGFSSGNYLEQPYNPDLDFGAGDFAYVFWAKMNSNARTLFRRAPTISDTASDGVMFALYCGVGGDLSLRVSNGSAFSYYGESGTARNDNAWHQIFLLRRSGVVEIWVDGLRTASHAIALDLTVSGAKLVVGYPLGGTAPADQMALFRVSATAPTPAQIARMYRDELPLFNPGAKACLGGTSNFVAAMDFDTWSQRLLVGTGDGVSEFSGLVRVGYFDTSNTPLTNDAMKAVAAQGGYRSMAGGQQSIVVRDKVSQHDVVNAYPEQLPAAVANEIAAIRALALLGTVS